MNKKEVKVLQKALDNDLIAGVGWWQIESIDYNDGSEIDIKMKVYTPYYEQLVTSSRKVRSKDVVIYGVVMANNGAHFTKERCLKELMDIDQILSDRNKLELNLKERGLI